MALVGIIAILVLLVAILSSRVSPIVALVVVPIVASLVLGFGLGMAVGYRGAPTGKSAARVRLVKGGRIVVETDMTDIGTGSYTIIAQTAAEMMGVGIDRVEVRLGDSRFPVSAGSGEPISLSRS